MSTVRRAEPTHGGSSPAPAADAVTSAPAQPTLTPAKVRSPHAFESATHAPTAKSFDALWDQQRYGDLIDSVGKYLAPLDPALLSSLSAKSTVTWTEELFLLQERLLGAANHLTLKHDGPRKKQALVLLQKVGTLQTAVFERIVELSNREMAEPVPPWQVFKNTYKLPGRHTPSESEALFLGRLQKFIRAGGNPGQIRTLDKTFLDEVQSGRLLEYGVDAFDHARVSYADVVVTPGHTLLTMGEDALTAGSMRIYKDKRGHISEVIIGSYSGHFRAGAQSQAHLARHLIALGVPKDRIVFSEGEAGTVRAMEIIAQAAGLDGAELQRRAARLQAEGERWVPAPTIDSASLATPTPRRDSGPRASRVGGDLNEAKFQLQMVTQSVLADSVVLSSTGEARRFVEAVDRVLVLAEKAGAREEYQAALQTLAHLASLAAPFVDDGASQLLRARLETWKRHTFGGSSDVAELLSPAPLAERRTRIMATVNPAASVQTLSEMITAGMDIARLNSAHSTPAELKVVIERIREASAAVGRPVTVELDLSGPKIRLGKFQNPKKLEYNDIWLHDDDTVTLTTASVEGTASLLPVDMPTFAQDVRVGDPVMLNDGNVELKVLSTDPLSGTVKAKVIRGGKVWDEKGINLPKSHLSVAAVTDEDLAVLDAVGADIDMLGVSFVHGPEDILFARAAMQDRGHPVPVIAKIETPAALERVGAIAQVSDALMVARGDLGVEIGYENVPEAERRILDAGNATGRPTIVATEVFQTLTTDNRPSRAEVEATYSAVHDHGADAIMLAKETSFGKRPADAIRAASLVLERAEQGEREDAYRSFWADELRSEGVPPPLKAG
jgi:pyruvate kinase